MSISNIRTTVEAINTSSEVKLTVTLFLNSSLSWLKPSDAPATTPRQMFSIIILSFVLLVSLILNLVVVISIYSSRSLKRVPLYLLLLHMAFSCLLEIVLNIPFALYYATKNSWSVNPKACSFNAFTVLLVTLELTLGVSTMCFERLVALRKPCHYKRFTECKQTVVIATLWLAGALMLLPVLLEFIDAEVCLERLSCKVIYNKEFIYGVILTLGYIMPYACALLCLLYLIAKWCYSRLSRSSRKLEMSYTEMFFEESFLWNEWATIKQVSIFVFLFSIFIAPDVVINQLPVMVPSKFNSNANTNSTRSSSVINPKVVSTFAWFRHLFMCLFPIAVLVTRKDIRKKCLGFLRCCRRVVVTDTLPVPLQQPLMVKPEDDFDGSQSVACLTAPVLFATSDGFQLKIIDVSARMNKKVEVPDWDVSSGVKPQMGDFLCDLDEGICVDSKDIEIATDDELDTNDIQDFTLPCRHSVKEVGVQVTSPDTTNNRLFDDDQEICTKETDDKTKIMKTNRKDKEKSISVKKDKNVRNRVQFITSVALSRLTSPLFHLLLRRHRKSQNENLDGSIVVASSYPKLEAVILT